METKFTKGNWSVDGFDLTSIISDMGDRTFKHIAKCNYGYLEPEKHFEENCANATLMANSPKLLEALFNLYNAVNGDTVENLKIALADARGMLKRLTRFPNKECEGKTVDLKSSNCNLADVTRQREQLAISALKKIARPIEYLRKEAEEQGNKLDGIATIALVEKGHFYQMIAEKVLVEIDNCG